MNGSPRFQSLLLAVTFATTLVTFATAGIGLYVALGNSGDIQDVHILMNSRLDELLIEAKKNARAEGVIEGENR